MVLEYEIDGIRSSRHSSVACSREMIELIEDDESTFPTAAVWVSDPPSEAELDAWVHGEGDNGGVW